MDDINDEMVVEDAQADAAAPLQGTEIVAYKGGAIDPYHAIARVPITKSQQKQLADPVDIEHIDILPTGEIYVSQVWYRRILNKIFGAGQWALLPRGEYSYKEWVDDYGKPAGTLMREYIFLVNGAFVSQCVGEADYHEANARMSYATAAESLKSNALSRCCKDLGIASECWDRRFAETWKAANAVEVWVEGKKRPQWRRTDAKAFYGEKGLVDNRQRPPQEPTPRPASFAPQHANPPRQPEPIFSNADNWLRGIVNAVTEKATKTGKTYLAVLIGKQWLNVFDGKQIDLLKQAKDAEVWYTTKTEGAFTNLVKISFNAPESQQFKPAPPPDEGEWPDALAEDLPPVDAYAEPVDEDIRY